MADELKDSRYGQLEKEYETEVESNKSLYSQTGFGRSTNNITALDKISQEYQQRIKTLDTLIGLESLAKQGVDVGKALASVQTQFTSEAQQAAQRRSDLIQQGDEIAAQALDQIHNQQSPRGGTQISPQQKKMGIRIMPNPSGQKQLGPSRVFIPVKSTSSQLAPKGKTMFKRTLIPRNKTFHL